MKGRGLRLLRAAALGAGEEGGGVVVQAGGSYVARPGPSGGA
jgi:hypothetical protein